MSKAASAASVSVCIVLQVFLISGTFTNSTAPDRGIAGDVGARDRPWVALVECTSAVYDVSRVARERGKIHVMLRILKGESDKWRNRGKRTEIVPGTVVVDVGASNTLSTFSCRVAVLTLSSTPPPYRS
jgi:hypothetical protein